MLSLFATPVLLAQLGLSDSERGNLRERALKAYVQNNPTGKPWSRSTRTSLCEQDQAFSPLFEAIRRIAGAAFGVTVATITGRELIQNSGDFIPPHVESSALSAIYWIDCAANPDHARADHNGALVLQSPVGPYGGNKLSQEKRVHMIDPQPDMLLIFPSYLLHFGHVYQGPRPSVEVHMEMEVA